jgi:hypothetical protein
MNFQEKSERLIAMQKLCLQVEQDCEAMDKCLTFLEEARKRQQELSSFYEEEWTNLVYDDDINPSADADVLSEVLYEYIPEGHYSIMSEDTIWNALVDHRESLLNLLKTIVPMID